MIKKAFMLGTAMLFSGSLQAQPSPEMLKKPTGEMLAQTCAGCHGTRGKLESVSAFMPLAGMNEERFIKAMTDFKTGDRLSTLMGPLAQAFSESEIKAMAKYFAQQPK